MYEARIERDSITQYGERLTTFVVTMPRLVLAEFNTHRQFSRSSASSRAIPVEKQLRRLEEDPFIPVHWGKNQKGMQADEELMPVTTGRARDIWQEARYNAISGAKALLELGVHKQITNRLLEPFMWHTVIVTATEWSNFFHLRDNKMAQPEIQKAAGMMSELYRASRPQLLSPRRWHLPFTVTDDFVPQPADEEGDKLRLSAEELIRASVGRAARVSYLTHDGKRDVQADIKLAESLLKNGHMAPWEHVARPMTDSERQLFARDGYIVPAHLPSGITDPDLPWKMTGAPTFFLGNFNGWVQARKLIHGEQDILAFERQS
jgi:thymidylate synthase ThyX